MTGILQNGCHPKLNNPVISTQSSSLFDSALLSALISTVITQWTSSLSLLSAGLRKILITLSLDFTVKSERLNFTIKPIPLTALILNISKTTRKLLRHFPIIHPSQSLGLPTQTSLGVWPQNSSSRTTAL